jgi:glutathione S-transferase
VRYELYYWPGIQGRGEFVRLALEDAGADYVDWAQLPEKDGGGVAAMTRFLEADGIAHPPFAPPFLKAGRTLIGQTANILLFLGGRLDLAPRDAAGKRWTHQVQLTITDFVAEIHDTHHPLGPTLYYEQQRAPAKRRTKAFLTDRLPKFLGYFERIIERNPTGATGIAGERLTYADLSLAQVVAGLRFAFPKAATASLGACPRLVALHDEAFSRPRLASYLASERRIAFNNDDVFRHYPKLDG